MQAGGQPRVRRYYSLLFLFEHSLPYGISQVCTSDFADANPSCPHNAAWARDGLGFGMWCWHRFHPPPESDSPSGQPSLTPKCLPPTSVLSSCHLFPSPMLASPASTSVSHLGGAVPGSRSSDPAWRPLCDLMACLSPPGAGAVGFWLRVHSYQKAHLVRLN